jgi:hypothetical protein
MSEQAPAPQDTPTNDDTPQDGTVTQDQDVQQQNWEERYKEAQAWGTRVAQEKAQLEQQAQLVQALQSDDAGLRKQAFEALGLELADETVDDTQYADPSEQLAKRLEALEQSLQQQNQQAAQAQQIAQIEAHVEAQLGTLDGLDDSDREWIVNTAVAMPPTAEGMPDIQAAHEKFVAWETERQKKWAASKKAHPFSAVGAEGTQQPDLKTRQGKVDLITNLWQPEESA